MQEAGIIEKIINGDKLVDPTFLNLEYLFYQIYRFFVSIDDWLVQNSVWIKFFSILLCVVFLIMIIYFIIGIYKIHKNDDKKLEDEYYEATAFERELSASAYASGNEQKLINQKRWNNIIDHLESENENDWRFAIIDADNMLEDLLKEEGYSGDGVGEMLKNAEVGDFVTLDKAWSAHKVRNDVTHGGALHNLSRRKALESVANFEQVFREFDYI